MGFAMAGYGQLAAASAPALAVLVGALITSISNERPKLSASAALLQLIRASRLLLFRQQYGAYLRVRGSAGSGIASALDFIGCIRYRHYLSNRLTLRQRVESVLHHARYEKQYCRSSLRDTIFHGGGLELWREVVDGVAFSVRLVDAQDNAVEGQLSVVAYVEAQRICVMSFSYVDSEIFGLPSESILFVARNQSDAGSSEKSLFNKAFKQIMPSYFCLAAISGIALALGMKRIAAVKARAHVGYEARHQRSFDHSYGSFWNSFQTHAIDDHVVLLPVPLELSPIDQVSAKHRNRARHRRQRWQEIRRGACSAMHPFLRAEAGMGAAALSAR